MFINETKRLIGQPVCQVFAFLAVFQVWYIPWRTAFSGVGPEEGGRMTGCVPGYVHVETLVLRKESLIAQVPFANKACGITSGLEVFGDGCFFQWQLPLIVGLQELPFLLAPDPVRDIQSRGVFAGHQGCSRG